MGLTLGYREGFFLVYFTVSHTLDSYKNEYCAYFRIKRKDFSLNFSVLYIFENVILNTAHMREKRGVPYSVKDGVKQWELTLR